MWDTVENDTEFKIHLSHDLPCLLCGHAPHSFLACSDSCECQAAAPPGVA